MMNRFSNFQGAGKPRRQEGDMDSPNAYYKWWRRHFSPRFSKFDVIHRLTNKLWVHYNNINLVRERLDKALDSM